jgi:hypothetical protein
MLRWCNICVTFCFIFVPLATTNKMVEVIFNTKKYFLKTSYSELNTKEFLKCAWIREQYLTEISEEKFHALRIEAFAACSNVPYRKILQVNTYQWIDMLPKIDFVFTTPVLTKNLLPSIKPSFFGKRLYGPIGLMQHSIFHEFIDADTAFTTANNEFDVEQITKLASILYRPKRKDLKKFKNSPEWNGDIREPYNQEQAVNRIAELKRLPFYKLVAIFLYYEAFRAQEVVNSPGFLKMFEGEDKVQGLPIGWLGTLYAISNGKFGDYEKTKKQHWEVVLVSIANDLELAESIEREKRERAAYASLGKR